jgi:hypothetical protein
MAEQAKATTRTRAADLGSRIAALHPEGTAEEAPAPKARAPRAPRAARAARMPAAAPAMPAAQKTPERWPERISLKTDTDMKRALEQARLDDRIEVTARIRAMIQLWQEDDRLRARVDRRARDLR